MISAVIARKHRWWRSDESERGSMEGMVMAVIEPSAN